MGGLIAFNPPEQYHHIYVDKRRANKQTSSHPFKITLAQYFFVKATNVWTTYGDDDYDYCYRTSAACTS